MKPSSSTLIPKQLVTIAMSSSLLLAWRQLISRPDRQTETHTCLYAFTTSLGPPSRGTTIFSITEAFGSLVFLYPTKKSSIPNSTLPSAVLATTFAPTATHTGLRSLIGDAVAMFPPTLATLRICHPAK